MKLDLKSKEYETMIEEMKEGKENIKTPWGNAKINNGGYYYITNDKEGFKGKYAHRLIWEAFYEEKISDDSHIHHRDGNPLNNALQNLECIKNSEHISIHKKDKPRPEEIKQKISETLTLPYARILKKGTTRNGKQNYSLRFNGNEIKYSIDPNKLLYWFLENYPLEIIKVPSYCRKNK